VPWRTPPCRLALAVALALACAACGHDFVFDGGPPHEPSTVAATYDISASYPTLFFPEFSATGIHLDVTLELDPATLGNPSGIFAGTVTVQGATVGGLARSFDPTAPLAVTGRIAGGEIAIDPFGGVTVGNMLLFPALTGMIETGGHRIDGIAELGNLPESGTWFGIKQRRYLIAATDFSTQGTVSIVTVRYDTQFKVSRDVELVSGDAVAAASAGGAFVVNRLSFDNIQILDPAKGFTTARQFSTGSGSNPHDALLAAPGRLYIPRYETAFNDILIADPSTGGTLGTIPLGAIAANASHSARPDRLVLANGLVLATLQNIDSTFFEYGPGLLAFIDPSDGTVVRAITLAGQNPIGPPSIRPDNGAVYLADAGVFQGLLPQTLSGGIEVIDPISLTTRGILVDDDDLGGNVSGVAVASGTVGYAVVVTSASRNDVVAFDPNSGAIGSTILSTAAFIPEIRYDGDGFLLVAEHDLSNPRLRVFDAATGTEITRIALSLPPSSMAILTRSLTVTP